MAKSKKCCGCDHKEKERTSQKDKNLKFQKEDLLWVFFCIKMITEIMGDAETRKKLMDAKKAGVEDIFELSILEPLVRYPKLPPPQAKTPPGSAMGQKPSASGSNLPPPKPGKAPAAK